MRQNSTLVLVQIVCVILSCGATGSAWTDEPSTPVVREYDIRTFGAVGDGQTKCTSAMQAAIDAAAAAGGGTVHVPAGAFVTGTLRMKSHVRLFLDAGAVILASLDLDDYPIIWPGFKSYSDTYVNQSLIYGEGLEHIAITGFGTIDGRGASETFPRHVEGRTWGQRPYLIRFVSCRGVRVEGIRLLDSPMWTQHYLACEDVTLRGLFIRGHVRENNDAMDIDCCRDVRISDCVMDTDDDGITLKSTADRICENVTITNCVVATHCNAIKLGTESVGGFRGITISNCVVRPSAYPNAKIRTWGNWAISGISLLMVDGGVLDGVTITNVTIDGAMCPIFMRLGNRARPYTEGSPVPAVGSYRNVCISNVIARGAADVGCGIAGLTDHPIENVTLRDITIISAGGGTREQALRAIPELEPNYPEAFMFGKLPAHGFYARHVRGLTLDGITLRCDQPDARPALLCDDVQQLRVRGLRGPTPANDGTFMTLHAVKQAQLGDLEAPPNTATYLRVTGPSEDILLTTSDLHRAATAITCEAGAEPTCVHETANRMGITRLPPNRIPALPLHE